MRLLPLPLVLGCSMVYVDADTALPAGEPDPTQPPSDTAPAPLPPHAVCLDTGPALDAPVPDFSTDVEPIFSVCVHCHQANPTGLVFEDPYAELVDIPSSQLPSMDRVEPGDLRVSYLWHKLCDTHEQVGGSGDAMPVQGAGLTEEDAVVIGAWILAGAPP